MSHKANDVWNENLEELKMDKYAGKKLCKECKNNYHPESYQVCWNCWSKKPSKVLRSFKS